MNPIESERAITSLVLNKGSEAALQAGDRLEMDLFTDNDCRAVLTYCLKQIDKGKYIDLELMPKNMIPVIASIETSEGGGASLAHLDHHLDVLETQADRRRLDDVASMIKEQITQGDVSSLENKVQEALYSTSRRKTGMTDAADSVNKTMLKLEEQIANPSAIMGFSTGFKRLNRLTQGQRKKKMWIVAGRPGGGKSTLAQMFADAAMKQSDAKVMVFSMEMSHDEWTERWISAYSKVNLQEALVEKLPSQLQRLNEAASMVSRLRYTIYDRPKLTRSNLVRLVRQAAAKGFNYFILDHLGLMRFPSNDRHVEFGVVTSELRGLCKSLDIHFTVLVQLNRKAEEAMAKGESLAMRHLAEADGPVQDCDVCIGIDGDGSLNVLKNRGGKSGDTIQVDQMLEYYTIREAAVASPEEVEKSLASFPPGASA